MARQRFIWPTIWEDPDLGRLTSDHRLLYIGCFSLADDEGRILGEPVFLKSQVFTYRPITPAQVTKLRDDLAAACSSFKVYEHAGITYIAFLNWAEFQKPKYPRPSKFPPPPGTRKRRNPASEQGKPSGNDSGNRSGNDSPNIPGTVPPRDGLGLYPPYPPEKKPPRRRRSTPTNGLVCPHCGVHPANHSELEDHLELFHPQTLPTTASPDNPTDDLPL